MYYIGIDTGVNTGIAVWDNKQRSLLEVDCMKIHKAMEVVDSYCGRASFEGTKVIVRVEDARQRTWYGYNTPQKDRAKLQGAGSVKRDATIWEDYLTDLKAEHPGMVEFQMVAPKNNATKIPSGSFVAMTGWKKRTNEHGRDAAMLVFGF